MEYTKTLWNKENYNAFLEELKKLKDEKYRAFNKILVKSKYEIIGIRTPVIKEIAKSISKGDWQIFLSQNIVGYYEEIYIRGLIIGNLKIDKENLKSEIEKFLPLIDNWAICDGFTSNLKIIGKNKEYFFEWLKNIIKVDENFKIRFVLVAFLSYYTEKEYCEDILKICSEIKNKNYYVEMAQAWLISILYIKHSNRILQYLKDNNLDIWIHNKAIQKIRESKRVSESEKEELRKLKK